ncbi:hypothetical protein [Brevibacillus sp. SYSU BS000544]|uniref:hypothetical protein n=1 Tax=Brevibacillus sp. SYSU BS000544 TaxID=3416443 RepID=UPI003CE493F6
MGRFETLIAYMDRLIDLKKLNVDVDRDIKDCNEAIKQEIGIMMGRKEGHSSSTGSPFGNKQDETGFNPFIKRKQQDAFAGKKFNPFFEE